MSRYQAKKTTRLNLPRYVSESNQDDMTTQPIIDPYASISNTVTLDDVKILKGEFPNTVIQSHMDRTLFFRFWFGTGIDTGTPSLPYINANNVAKTLTDFNSWNLIYGSKDWNQYFSYVSTPNYIYTFLKTGLYCIRGSFGTQNTNTPAAVVLYFSGRGADVTETRQVFTIAGNVAGDLLAAGTAAVPFVHYEFVNANSTLTVKTLAKFADVRIGRYAFLTLTYLGNNELVLVA